MAQLSEKELATLQDLLADEELLVKKFKMLAEYSTDQEVKTKYEQISQKHQNHFNTLYALI